ncbi:GNAT family N-acetyltransferase [Thalassobius sp. Cn5-15]|uniref:GNAT family N-acetyltransferase n=1 Tax=Thalassobius sp. Cn5-15 TaxID=2917763 RepID=UPI001EF300D6|nr:GNAT family protein [Thalassobius sp. Cn5-15]MCG7492465.1 GNAT family N-acetyltransferase [Thalassobius sp. Cn5-15]
MAEVFRSDEAGQSAAVVGQLVLRADRVVADWVAKRLSATPWAGSFAAIGVLDKNRSGLIAGAVYHGFDGRNVIMSIAADSPNWSRKGILKSLFHYPFNSLGCQRVTATVDESNHRSLRLCRGLGFVQEGIIRQGADDGDVVLLGLLKAECRFL